MGKLLQRVRLADGLLSGLVCMYEIVAIITAKDITV